MTPYRYCLVLLFLVIISVIASPVGADVYLKNGTFVTEPVSPELLIGEITSQPNHPVPGFFYNIHCGACHSAKEFIEEVVARRPDIRVEQYDLFNNTTNRELFEAVKTEFGRNTLSYPIVIIGPVMLEGNEAIKTYFEPLAAAASEQARDPLSSLLSVVYQSEKKPGEGISILLILGAGLLDGINPCAFAVLVFLLTYLLTLSNRRRVLLTGLVYTSAVFAFYYLSGVGIFTIVQTTGLVTGFSVIAGIIALTAGLLMIKDAIIPGKGPTLAIPESRKATITAYIEKSSLPAAAILGVLVGMFELPCTGGIYLSIISMISLKTDLMTGLWYLVVYNIAFIFPLLIITGLVYWGISPERVNSWRLEQRRLLRLIIGLILLGCAAVILGEVLGFRLI